MFSLGSKRYTTLFDALVEPCRHFNIRIARFCESVTKVVEVSGYWMTDYDTRSVLLTDNQTPVALVKFFRL